MKSKWKRVSKKKSEELRKAAKEGRIEMAPQQKLKRVQEMVEDFVIHCLGCEEFMVTDLSSVYDFCLSDRELKKAFKKAEERYKISFKCLPSSRLVDIAGYILRQRAN